MTDKADVTTYTVKQALAVKVGDHIEIAVEAQDGTKLKLKATAEQLDALMGDLETATDAATGETASS